MRPLRWLRDHATARYVLAGVVAAPATVVVLVTLALGSCSAFGGRCPADPQPWWDDDVFGGVALGVAVAVFAVAAAREPTRRGVVTAAGAGIGLGVLAGLIGAGWAAG